MLIFPAIDLYDRKVVRLFKGDYAQMTVYSSDPMEIAKDFVRQGASHLHMVDLEGAKTGRTTNVEICRKIKDGTDLFVEVGGGIRDLGAVKRYVDAGADRIIFGTAAVENEALIREAVGLYGDKIAVGIDLKDGYVAVKGWTEKTDLAAEEFALRMQDIGVSTIICTDISRDGAMKGTNRELYGKLSGLLKMNITASGGVSTLDDVKALRELGLYGAIVGKAYYEGAISIKDAIEAAM